MKLQRLIISNFRCFAEEPTVIDFSELIAYVGANSSGKTAAMHAVLKLFGSSQFERTIHRADFFVSPTETPDEIDERKMYIEAQFVFSELGENGETTVAVPNFINQMVIEGEGQAPILRVRLKSTYVKDGSPEGLIDTNIYFVTSGAKEGELTEEDFCSANRTILSNIKCQYVPAIRNPNDQLKTTTGTILYRLLNSVVWNEAATEKVAAGIESINTELIGVDGVKSLQDILQNEWSELHTGERYSKASIGFNSADLETTLKSASIKFAPTEVTRDYEIDELGDGLRSIFYFSLVNTLLKAEQKILEDDAETRYGLMEGKIAPPVLTILLVEEPENHIAPQLMGQVISSLKDTAKQTNAQVVLSSHTPSIIKRLDATSIRYFQFDHTAQASKVKTITLPPATTEAYTFVKEAVEAYPELYFAQCVVLGEGDSEIAVLPKLIEHTYRGIDSMGISVVPLGGRHVNHFWKLLTQLDIPFVTLLDLDQERYGGGWGRIKYVLDQLKENGMTEDVIFALNADDVLNAESFGALHTRGVNDEKLRGWISCLREYNIFFSAPLDFDFLLLEKYPSEYKETVDGNSGPRIVDAGKIIDLEKAIPENEQYRERYIKNTADVLKDEGGEGLTYNTDQKKLMIWYKYLFLDRSKPITHMQALAKIDFSNPDNMPEPLKALCDSLANLNS